jgi:hypothetical protein
MKDYSLFLTNDFARSATHERGQDSASQNKGKAVPPAIPRDWSGVVTHTQSDIGPERAV